MEIQNQLQENKAGCCVDFCKDTYTTEEAVVINQYKCNRKQISSRTIWNIWRNRKEVAIRKMI